MKRLLILFADRFPYGNSEPFLEKEYPLYKDYFDHVLLSTACKRGDIPTRETEGVEVISDYTLSKDIGSIIGAIPWLLSDIVFYQELGRLINTKKLTIRKLRNEYLAKGSNSGTP